MTVTDTIDVSFVSSIVGLGGIPFIAALVQILKAFIKDSRYYPVLAIFMGLGVNLGAYAGLTPDWSNIGWTQASFQGLAVGLASAGAYEIVRAK